MGESNAAPYNTWIHRMIDALFWLSFALFLYAYIGYPLLIALLSRLKPLPANQLDIAPLPEVTIVLCVYNAEDSIAERLQNLCRLDYPADKLQILVVSDGSTDQTVQRVEQLQDARIRCIAYADNRGKAYALSQAVSQIATDYTLFADGRQRFDADVIKQLLGYFADNQVGAVTGNLVIASGKGTPGLYWQYEKLIRSAESRYQSLIGVTGAIYMARTSLVPTDLPQGLLLDDMYIPLQMVQQGYQVKFCATAVAHDRASGSLREEFDRKVRTLAGNYQLFRLAPWTMNPLKNPVWFQLLSHKVLRLLVPYLLIVLLLTSASSNNWLLQCAFAVQLLCYAVAGFSYFWLYRQRGQSNVILTFCMLNLAALKASWVNFRSPQQLWKRH
jgi:biofilm PGA synthesis N-glycosyltransferase PgaC